MFAKGQVVKIKPEWQDAGDEAISWLVVDADGDRLIISPMGPAFDSMAIRPTQKVKADMVEHVGPKQTLPEAIRCWVEREFSAKYVERVAADLIDVATGNRAGNAFELAAVEKIVANHGWEDCGEGPWEKQQDARDFMEAECGVPCKLVKRKEGWRIQVKRA